MRPESIVREAFYFGQTPSLSWFLPLSAIVLALLIAYVLWTRRQLGARVALLLAGLRLLAFAVLLGFLFHPTLLRQTLRRIPPEVAVLVDTSGSMGIREEGAAETRLERAKALLSAEASPLRRILSEVGKVRYFAFDLKTRPLQEADLPGLRAEGTATDISRALDEVKGAFSGTPLSAAILLSDGAANLGASGGAGAARGFGAPVVALGVGDRSRFKDLQVLDLRVPDLAFAGHEANVRFKVRALGLKGKRVPLALKRMGQVLATKVLTLSEEAFEEEVEFKFTPKEIGQFQFSVEAASQVGEHSLENNSRSFPFQVLRDKLRILYVSGRPSWNYRFFRQALKSEPGIDLVSFVILRTVTDAVDIPQSELSLISFPTERIFTKELENFDVLIFDNFSFRPYFPYYYLENIAKYVDQGGAFLMLGGEQSFGGGGYADSPLEAILPVELHRPARPYAVASVRPGLTGAGKTHPISQLSPDPEENLRIWSRLPPLRGYNPALRAKPGATVLAVLGTDGSPGESGPPLMTVMTAGQGRTMAILTDSLWRWNFEMVGSGWGNQPYLRLVKSAIHWLARSPSLDRVRLSSLQSHYRTGEEVEVRLRVLDESYQPARAEEVAGLLTDPYGTRIPLRFEAAKETGLYVARPLLKVPGPYRVSAEARQGERTLGAGELSLTAQPFNLEGEDASPRGEYLQALARATGGAYFEGSAFNAASAEEVGRLLEGRVRHDLVEERELPLWRIEYVFVALVLLLGTEWVLRRRRGLP
jgi:uncharacterized membrane protein